LNLFIQYLFSDPHFFITVALVVLFSVSVHEYFHAQVALWEGDSTAADLGHLTLNPLKQLGVLSLIMFCLVGICWGSTPIDNARLRGRWSRLKVNMAGPFANLLLFAGSWVAYGLLVHREISPGLISLIANLGITNFVLFTLNLIPAPGLDGWHIACEIFPSLNRPQTETAKGIMIFLILAVFLFIDYLYKAGLIAMRVAAILLG